MDAVTLLAASSALKNILLRLPVQEYVGKLADTGGVTNDLLEKLLQREPLQQIEQRRSPIDRLTDAHRAKSLVLCLGAGVSIPYGLPDWNTLLQELLLTTLNEDSKAIDDQADALAKLYTAVFAPNPLIAARYLATYYRKRSKSALAFESAIRDVLYRNVQPGKHTELFSEIRRLSTAHRDDPILNSVITYNFDDLLERSLCDFDSAFPFKAVFSVGDNPSPAELPIYHVHGYLPAKGELTKNHCISFSDDQYHEQYQDVYRWSNMVQIMKFKDNTCLFLGTSFTDPNLRRLLDIARRQRGSNQPAHVLIRKHYDKTDLHNQLRKALGDASTDMDEARIKELDETVEKLRRIAEKFEEEDARSLGVDTVWVESYDDIPKVLKQIREEARPHQMHRN